MVDNIKDIKEKIKNLGLDDLNPTSLSNLDLISDISSLTDETEKEEMVDLLSERAKEILDTMEDNKTKQKASKDAVIDTIEKILGKDNAAFYVTDLNTNYTDFSPVGDDDGDDDSDDKDDDKEEDIEKVNERISELEAELGSFADEAAIDAEIDWVTKERDSLLKSLYFTNAVSLPYIYRYYDRISKEVKETSYFKGLNQQCRDFVIDYENRVNVEAKKLLIEAQKKWWCCSWIKWFLLWSNRENEEFWIF